MTLFPITNAEKYIRAFAPSLVRTGDTLKWASEDGISELSVTPLNQRTSDGLIVSEVVTLTHTSPAFANLSSEWISRFNSFATISALVPGDELGQLSLFQRLECLAPIRLLQSRCTHLPCVRKLPLSVGMRHASYVVKINQTLSSHRFNRQIRTPLSTTRTSRRSRRSLIEIGT